MTTSQIKIDSFNGITAILSYGSEYKLKELVVPEEFIGSAGLNMPAFLDYASGFTPELIEELPIKIYGTNEDIIYLSQFLPVQKANNIYETGIILTDDIRDFKEFNNMHDYYIREKDFLIIRQHSIYLDSFITLNFAKSVIDDLHINIKIVDNAQFMDSAEFNAFAQNNASVMFELWKESKNLSILIDTDVIENLKIKYPVEFNSTKIPNVAFSNELFYIKKLTPNIKTIKGYNDGVQMKPICTHPLTAELTKFINSFSGLSIAHAYFFTIQTNEDMTEIYNIKIGTYKSFFDDSVMALEGINNIIRRIGEM